MSIYDVNGNYANTVYGIDGDILSLVYDVDGNLLSDVVFDDTTTISSVYTSTTTLQPQGGCVDDDGNIYTCLYDSGSFIKYNLTTRAEARITPPQASGSQPWGHANGMTYNPNTGYLYLASMNETGEVYVFDKSLNLVNTLYAVDENDNVFRPWNIAYNRITNEFIIVRGGWQADYEGRLYILNCDFSYKSVTPFNITAWKKYTTQDLETDGSYIYCVGYDPNYILVYDFQGNVIKEISNTAFSGEPESLMYDWDTGNFYIEGKDSYYVIRQAVFKRAVIQ